MDQSTLVGTEIDEGRRFVERFAADGNPIEAAFWAKSDENDMWFLFVATAIYDRLGPLAASRAMHASLDKLDDLGGLPVRSKGLSDPLVKHVLAVMARHSGRSTIRAGGIDSFEIGYVYPPRLFTVTRPDPMTAEEIGRELLRLMRREHGRIQPSHVVLKDGTAFDGVPFSVQVQAGGQESPVVQFIVDREFAPRVVGLDAIASIV